MELYQVILLLVSLVSFSSYILYVVIRYGIQRSISQSYYNLKNSFGKTKADVILFFFIFFTVVPIMIVSAKPVMIVGGGILMLVGVAPAFNRQSQFLAHMIGSIVGIATGFMSLIFEEGIIIIPSIMALFIIFSLLIKLNNYIWWVENLAYVLILSAMILPIITV